jgi:hypothetical protein
VSQVNVAFTAFSWRSANRTGVTFFIRSSNWYSYQHDACSAYYSRVAREVLDEMDLFSGHLIHLTWHPLITFHGVISKSKFTKLRPLLQIICENALLQHMYPYQNMFSEENIVTFWVWLSDGVWIGKWIYWQFIPLGTTSNYSAVTDFRTLQITTAHAKTFQPAVS